MKKRQTTLLFDKWIEQIIIHYGDQDVKRKIEFVKNFVKDKFQINEYDNSYIEIERVHSKSLLWLLLTLIIEYETSQKMKILEKTGMQEKYKSLEVRDIFSVEELTAESVQFIEKFLEKTNVDLESEVNYYFIVSTNQMIYLLRKIMQEYRTFLSNGEKYDE